jgi:hypothetical protein
MWPGEGARQVTWRGGSAEGRARRWRSGGGRGHSGSGDRAAWLDQQAARGAIGVHKEEFKRSWEWRHRLEGGAHRRRQWRDSGGSERMRVRARSDRGWIISAREVGWGRWGHAGATCTRGEAGGMADDARRFGGQWRATGGAPAGGSAPPGAAHLPRTARECSRRHSTVTNGHSDASTCAPDAGTVRTAGGRRGRARRRGGARLGRSRRFLFAEVDFKMNFLRIFKLKCTLRSEAKLKIKDPSITFTKVGRGFVQGIEQEHHGKLAKFSALVNSGPVPCFAISTILHSKPAMPLNSKVVCLDILHVFPFGWFWSV